MIASSPLVFLFPVSHLDDPPSDRIAGGAENARVPPRSPRRRVHGAATICASARETEKATCPEEGGAEKVEETAAGKGK